MTTNITTHNHVRSDVLLAERSRGGVRPATSRAWALPGIGAGLAGLGTLISSGMVDAVYDDRLHGDPAAIAQELARQTPQMMVFHTCTLLGAVLMVAFAAGLFRRLREVVDERSAAPLVAFAGLLGTAVVSVLGSGLDTEFMVDLGNPGLISPDNAAMYNHWIGTVPWCWVLAGLTGLALHGVSRAAGVPRWIGRTGLVLGGLTLLIGVSPLQYAAGVTGALWLLVTAIGFTVGDRAFRAGR